jgi:hypothetical protein
MSTARTAVFELAERSGGCIIRLQEHPEIPDPEAVCSWISDQLQIMCAHYRHLPDPLPTSHSSMDNMVWWRVDSSGDDAANSDIQAYIQQHLAWPGSPLEDWKVEFRHTTITARVVQRRQRGGSIRLMIEGPYQLPPNAIAELSIVLRSELEYSLSPEGITFIPQWLHPAPPRGPAESYVRLQLAHYLQLYVNGPAGQLLEVSFVEIT